MGIMDIFKVNQIKAELAASKNELSEIKKVMAETERMTLYEIQNEIEKLKASRSNLQSELGNIQAEIATSRKDLIVLTDELLLQSFGFYKNHYAFDNSEQYKARIDAIRAQQAKMIKDGTATQTGVNWTLNGDAKQGAQMIKDYVKLIVRSFNNECDASIGDVKFNNIASIEKKIEKAFETLNKLGSRMTIQLTHDYYNLKLQELYLCHEYQQKKQEEKEEQKRLKEQMREEAKLMKEIEEAKLRIEKEQKHFLKAVQQINTQLAQAATAEEKAILQEKKTELEGKLTGLEKDKLDVLNREQNTRAGYVYIISNIGAFGDQVYKIGVTRRLDPTERIDELGDASVPFDFDIHAMIFSDDAPKLETALHQAFSTRRLNMINYRREFFNVTLDEIESEVKKNFNKTVEFTKLAEAAEYRESQMMKQQKIAPVGV